jgi:hypothetical protein
MLVDENTLRGHGHKLGRKSVYLEFCMQYRDGYTTQGLYTE